MLCGDAPASLRALFKDAETPPEWLDYAAFAPGVRMFHRNSQVCLAAFVAGVLIEGFTTNIAKSFFITGRVRDQGVRRLGKQPSHDGDIPSRRAVQGRRRLEALGPHQDSSRPIEASPEQLGRVGYGGLGGAPISAAHLGYAISAFSARLLKHMKTLGATYTDEEYASFMAVWRYSGS